MVNDKFSNRLSSETSPYLLQHKNNPVDWYPWGEAALARAESEDKPIFLSIGYSACHWCHVMEHESFEDNEVANILNANFISIKVDREERPDIDSIYMDAVQMISGQGGWPMSMFLFPDLRPFYGGTYFPPEDRWGRPGFKSLLVRIVEMYKKDKDNLHTNALKIVESLQDYSVPQSSDGVLSRNYIMNAVSSLKERFDSTWGGFGEKPKFPPSMALMLLLRVWKRNGDKELLEIVEFTLQRMALGGMYDQLGGGFHRYSVDEYWLIPHFEKMLYDNALLVQVYIEAFQATKNEFYKSIATETLDYVLREMSSPEGGFYAAQDADSEGEEGKFFAWTPSEIYEVLGEKEGKFFTSFYGVTEKGNFEKGTNALFIQKPPKKFCEDNNIEYEKLLFLLQNGKEKLFLHREKRIKPGLDDKILTSWNGLMIGSMAKAGRILNNQNYLDFAEKSADFILDKMWNGERFVRSYRLESGKLNAYLDDYAFMIQGLTELYESTFNSRWLDAAVDIAHQMSKLFEDNESGGFFFTSKDHEKLIVRKKMSQDGAIPSGNSIAVLSLLRLSRISGEGVFEKMAEKTMKVFSHILDSAPAALHMMLVGLDFYLDTPMEIVLSGDLESEDSKEMLNVIHSVYLPNKVLAFNSIDGSKKLSLPILKDKSPIDNNATVFLCENYACKLPMVDPEVVRKSLE